MSFAPTCGRTFSAGRSNMEKQPSCRDDAVRTESRDLHAPGRTAPGNRQGMMFAMAAGVAAVALVSCQGEKEPVKLPPERATVPSPSVPVETAPRVAPPSSPAPGSASPLGQSPPPALAGPINTVDPVSGKPIVPGIVSVYKGFRIGHCCNVSKDEWAALSIAQKDSVIERFVR